MVERSLFNVETPDGYIVCECNSLKEAVACKKELIKIDKLDEVYVEKFYRIVRGKVQV